MVHNQYIHQFSPSSPNYSNLLFIKYYQFLPINISFLMLSLTYCFIWKLLIHWSKVRILHGPPKRMQSPDLRVRVICCYRENSNLRLQIIQVRQPSGTRLNVGALAGFCSCKTCTSAIRGGRDTARRARRSRVTRTGGPQNATCGGPEGVRAVGPNNPSWLPTKNIKHG